MVNASYSLYQAPDLCQSQPPVPVLITTQEDLPCLLIIQVKDVLKEKFLIQSNVQSFPRDSKNKHCEASS